MYRLIEYGSMLRDRRRVEAYSGALAAVVSPSSVVLDLGAGIGTFSILACKYGCARVYAVEPGDVIGVARANASANGVAGRIHFLQARATDIELPEQVDVIVSDLGGALPLFEEHLTSVMDARDRFLKPAGVLIPRRDRLMCAPVSAERLHAEFVEPWRAVAGVDLTPAETIALHTPHPLRVDPADLAAEPQCWADLDYATITSPHVSASMEWSFPSPREIHGVALWFDSTLYGDITYASGPWFPDSVHATMVLPLRVHAAEQLTLSLEATLTAGRYVVTWDQGGGRPARLSRASRPDGNDLLLFDRVSGEIHVLNETAARVWEALRRGDDVETIVAAMARDYEVDAPRASNDVAAIVLDLQRAGLMD